MTLQGGSDSTRNGVEAKLREAGITPTIEACQAYRLGFWAGKGRGTLTSIKWHPKPCPPEL